ncbi:thioesterase family protein [Tomitella biformata]|uniref:thioesterase family protein n=1 Tax=Tomitella biformata TaxID=630403 RepID=UPI0004B62455|nr:thioesterase family protein [Tomitella biformata]
MTALTPPFSAAMALTSTRPGSYCATISQTWTIGPKVHGGTMLAVCGAAARAALGAHTGGLDAAVEPVSISASYLSAPNPGEVQLTTTVRKSGRRVSLVEVELAQGGRVAVHAVVTLAVPDDAAPLHAAGSTLADLSPTPDATAVEVSSSPMGAVMNLASACEIWADAASAKFANPESVDGTGDIHVRMWVRPRGEAPDALFALMAGDVSAPVTLNLGRFGWAPTIQLTTYLRALPVDGWLRVEASSTLVGQRWFEEDHLVLDEAGTVVVQSRQLAMVPEAGPA